MIILINLLQGIGIGIALTLAAQKLIRYLTEEDIPPEDDPPK